MNLRTSRKENMSPSVVLWPGYFFIPAPFNKLKAEMGQQVQLSLINN